MKNKTPVTALTTKEDLADFFLKYSVTMPDSTNRSYYWVEDNVLCMQEEHYLTFVSPDTIRFIIDNNVPKKIFWEWYNTQEEKTFENGLEKYFID